MGKMNEPYIRQRQGKFGLTYQVNIDYGNGIVTKSFSEKDYGSSKLAKECAIRYRNKALVERAEGSALRNSRMTVQEIFDDFIETSILSINTKEKHESWFRLFVNHKDKPIQQLTRADIIKDLNAMVSTSSNDTIGRVLSLYRKDIIEHALNKEIINRDITLGLNAPESHVYKEKKERFISRAIVDEVLDLLLDSYIEVYEKKLIYFLIEVLYYTGMRPAEAEALTKSDIHDTYITINKELGSNADEYNVVRHCKTQSSVRRIPINTKLRPILNELLRFAQTEELFMVDGEYLNSTRVGAKLSYLLKKENIKFSLYSLRHNMATELVTNNVDQKTTMEILGHSSFDMSLYYATSNDELKQDAIELLS